MKCAVRHLLLCVGLINSTLGSGCISHKNSNPIVTTPLGTLEGSTMKTRNGAEIHAFRGIPYAAPPIGDLRFKPPKPAEAWQGVYNATENPKICPQFDAPNSSEDCLYLNVYHQKTCNANSSKPVMVFFHPGGFYEGTTSSDIYGPQYLLDEDIVLVIPAYRLGILGFLSTGTEEAPGNNGFKDQVLALKWVQDNIASFCGDPNQVTITGYSAGGFSVTVHLVSPMSRGLFHRAIAMSGSSFGNLPINTSQLNLAQRQAELVGCPNDTPEEIVTCLKTKPAQELADTFLGFKEFQSDPIWIWTVVIEPDFGQERFIVEHPITSIINGRFSQVPVIIGITTDEFGGRSFDVVGNDTALQVFNEDYKRVWPIVVNYERNTSLSNQISEGLRRFYFPDDIIDATKRQEVADLYTDGITGFAGNRGAKILAEHNQEDVFYYRFSYVGRYTHFYVPGTNYTVPYGAYHHDDLLYLFYVSVMTPMFDELPESTIVDHMTKLWSNFVKTGHPTSSDLTSVDWPRFAMDSQQFLDISTNLTVKDHLFNERNTAWEQLLPLALYS